MESPSLRASLAGDDWFGAVRRRPSARLRRRARKGDECDERGVAARTSGGEKRRVFKASLAHQLSDAVERASHDVATVTHPKILAAVKASGGDAARAHADAVLTMLFAGVGDPRRALLVAHANEVIDGAALELAKLA